MASSMRSATRYTSTTTTLNTSTRSDPSSSSEFSSSRAISRALTTTTTKKNHAQSNINFTSMVKKLVEGKKAKSNYEKGPQFVIANKVLAEELKKNAKKSTGIGGLHKKLFKGSNSGAKAEIKDGSRKALTEVKSNTRTLAMVLRSERELLSLNQEKDKEIDELKALLEEKNREVEKLKDLCLKQREEIKSLKSAVLFPDTMNSHLQDVLETQSSELKHAKQLIPSLQRQVTSLTGQLQSLADDLAEVKAAKYSVRGFCDDRFSSPRTPSYDQEDAANYLYDQEFSSGDYTNPDDMFLQDLNPCLTPRYSKTKSKEYDAYGVSPEDDASTFKSVTRSSDYYIDSIKQNISESSECCKSCKSTNVSSARSSRRSGEDKFSAKGSILMHHHNKPF